MLFQRLLVPVRTEVLNSLLGSRFCTGSQLKRCMEKRAVHLDRTKGLPRHDLLADAIVTKISNISPTVKLLSLKVDHPDFTFYAGQWLDVFIPSLSTVGGFSICSDPIAYKETSHLDLAVKNSDHPPANWVHTECANGSPLKVRVGGDFHFTHADDLKRKQLLLIAGGVGINPIFSIVSYISKLDPATNSSPTLTKILYSAKQDELIFKDDIEAMCKQCSSMDAIYHMTGTTKSELNNNTSRVGRITPDVISATLASFTSVQAVTCYVCGPPGMITDITTTLKSFGLEDGQIKYEKWW